MTFYPTLMNSDSFQFNQIQSQLGLDSKTLYEIQICYI